MDIGGASTELVTGTGAQTTSLFSLSMGCVTIPEVLQPYMGGLKVMVPTNKKD